jgi:hypothetical protein
MVSFGKYMNAYFNAVTSRRYWVKLGPLGGLFLIGFIKDIPGLNSYLVWAGIIWLFIVVFWWGFDFLNDELEKRDSDHLKTSPRAREDRAFHLLSRRLQDGKKALLGWTPAQIEVWDKNVRLTLADWCNESALHVYLNNTRPYNQEQLTDPQKALDELDKIVNVHLSLFMK